MAAVLFFFKSPLALELPPSPPLADGANEPLYAARRCGQAANVQSQEIHVCIGRRLKQKCCFQYCHGQNTSASASEVDSVLYYY